MLEIRYQFIWAFLILLIPSLAHADVGLPMIVFMYPFMCIALIPIILIEVWVLRKSLNVSFKNAFWSTSIANLVSTLIGIPFAWLLLVALEMWTGGGGVPNHGNNSIYTRFLMVTWEAPWLLPIDDKSCWMVPTASLVLLIPFFYASWFIEFWVIKFFYKEIKPLDLNRLEFKMNLYSYGFLAVLNIIWLVVLCALKNV